MRSQILLLVLEREDCYWLSPTITALIYALSAPSNSFSQARDF
jgi:hypothetical protein